MTNRFQVVGFRVWRGEWYLGRRTTTPNHTKTAMEECTKPRFSASFFDLHPFEATDPKPTSFNTKVVRTRKMEGATAGFFTQLMALSKRVSALWWVEVYPVSSCQG